MFNKKPDKQLRASLSIATTMSGLWLLGLAALTLAPADAGTGYAENTVNFRHQASGITDAYQDVTGRFTIYIRGSNRLFAP